MPPSTYLKGGVVALLIAGFASYLATRSHGIDAQAPGRSQDLSSASGLPDRPADSPASRDPNDGTRLPSRKADRSVEEAAKLELGITRLEEQIRQLKTREDKDKISYAVDLEFPDNPVRPLFGGYLEAKRNMEVLKTANGLGEKHPEVLAQQTVLDSMAKDLSQAVAGLSDQMETELDARREALLRMRSKR